MATAALTLPAYLGPDACGFRCAHVERIDAAETVEIVKSALSTRSAQCKLCTGTGSLWICMHCGTVVCTASEGSEPSHLITHLADTLTDDIHGTHALYLSITTGAIYCACCDQAVQYTDVVETPAHAPVTEDGEEKPPSITTRGMIISVRQMCQESRAASKRLENERKRTLRDDIKINTPIPVPAYLVSQGQTAVAPVTSCVPLCPASLTEADAKTLVSHTSITDEGGRTFTAMQRDKRHKSGARFTPKKKAGAKASTPKKMLNPLARAALLAKQKRAAEALEAAGGDPSQTEASETETSQSESTSKRPSSQRMGALFGQMAVSSGAKRSSMKLNVTAASLNKALGDKTQQIAAWRALLTAGAVMKKCGSKGKPHPRHFSLDTEGTSIHWRQEKRHSYKEKDAMPITDIIKLVRGQTTEVFKRSVDPALEDRAFSVIGTERTLDLYAKTEEQREEWIEAIEGMMTVDM
ncbi:phosphoinositide phospholipase C family [Kipferlia bialata]|uniref:Phosphoinositide phospholipase C family n=1 Tax=Kipferlia bialata TaxID=797122 RepID=A0A9K3CW20_9EUKA|nr:phosphoinositide phospholipase C family [Kipferlia bialata]|eukprot:g4793.t1